MLDVFELGLETFAAAHAKARRWGEVGSMRTVSELPV
jgi:hypothetical protein